MLLTFVFNFAIISYKLNLNCRKGGERGNKMTKKEIMQAVEGLRKNQSGRIAPTAEIAALARAAYVPRLAVWNAYRSTATPADDRDGRRLEELRRMALAAMPAGIDMPRRRRQIKKAKRLNA